MQGSWVQSLVGKLQSHKPHNAAKRIVRYIMLFLTSLKMYNNRSENEWEDGSMFARLL